VKALQTAERIVHYIVDIANLNATQCVVSHQKLKYYVWLY